MAQSFSFSTVQLPGAQSVEAWRQAMAEVYYRLDIKSDHTERLNGQLIDWQRRPQVKQEDNEEGVLSRWPEGQAAAFANNHLDRTKDPEVHPVTSSRAFYLDPAALLRAV